MDPLNVLITEPKKHIIIHKLIITFFSTTILVVSSHHTITQSTSKIALRLLDPLELPGLLDLIFVAGWFLFDLFLYHQHLLCLNHQMIEGTEYINGKHAIYINAFIQLSGLRQFRTQFPSL